MTSPLPHVVAQLHKRPQQLTAVKFKRNQIWISWNWGEYQENIKATYELLKKLEVKYGDTIAIMAPNKVEWALCDLASQCLGAVVVPIYPNCSQEDFNHILEQTKPKIIFFNDEKTQKKYIKPQNLKIIFFESSKDHESFFWNHISAPVGTEKFLEDCSNRKMTDLTTIVFTSGTSGVPKGVCLTQTQVMSELKSVASVFPITSQDVTLSFLPYAHILGRVEMWLSTYSSFTLAFCDTIETIKKDLISVKPTVLISVPRIFEKIYASVMAKLNSIYLYRFIQQFEGNGFLRSLSLAPARLLLQMKVKEKLKEAFGGRLKYAISGGAPLSRDLLSFFRQNDVLVLEGYGLTETTGAICVNTPDQYHFGSVGKPLPNVEIKLSNDSEILVKSDKVFDRLLIESPGKAKDSEGFFPTGDIGEWTSEGFLKITDRKKDLIKTSGGKYVAPQKIENLFKRYPLISQTLIHGDQKKYIVALLTLSPDELKELANSQKIPFSKVEDLVHSPQVLKVVEEIVKEVNSELAGFESIKKFHILNREFSIAEGELTPSLKVRRKICEEKYQNEILKLYGI